eukprot:TRINITY_DN29481_c0_g1_i3.p1 TRINITY_DN29481_c0_g1~~TRINITY_DN29481_c0_g1_i3.p1  ORF type:complete len:169 (-),score=59.92 TRINITY_DN29481_c0_g1_i3:11-517(-)
MASLFQQDEPELSEKCVNVRNDDTLVTSSTDTTEKKVITVSLRNHNNDWREVTYDPEDDSDTDDDDYAMEMFKSGRVVVTQLPDTVSVTRVPGGEDVIKKRKEELARRREEVRKMDRSQQDRGKTGGKRKFEERMTLQEAKVTDFEDSKDYVDFLQSKLQGINIKIVK